MNTIRRIVRLLRDGVHTARKTEFGKWSQIGIFFDYIYCRFKFHVSSDEYLMYRFYNFRDCYRKNFLLKYHQITQFRKINEWAFTRSKYKFYQKIPDCFYREIILAPSCGEECFLAFVKKHKQIVVKPDTGSLGMGIEFFSYTDDRQAKEYFSKLMEDTICEEFICQHEKMNKINPYSVNTIRVVSLRNQDEVEIISTTLKTGGKVGMFIDNMSQNGVGAQVDISTGTICSCGFNYCDDLFAEHPVSGVQILGFKIPNWEQALSLVKKAHKQLPQCALLAWDIAITQTGADIVEANSRPGTRLMQLVPLEPKGEKIIAAIKKAKKKKHE